jgi:hypothetical protein
LKISDRFVVRFPMPLISASACVLALAACERGPVDWSGDAYAVGVANAGIRASRGDVSLVLRGDRTPVIESVERAPTSPPDTAACPTTMRYAPASPSEIYAVWWSRRESGRSWLLSSRSDDSGTTWNRSVAVDTTDRATAGCERPAPAVVADSVSGYLHVAYFLYGPNGGVFFSHSMERGELFHEPVAIVYGDRPSATAVAAEDSTVVVAFEDPNGQRPQIALAISRTWGHIFARERPVVSGTSPTVERPLVALKHGVIAVGWRSTDDAIVARVGVLENR